MVPFLQWRLDSIWNTFTNTVLRRTSKITGRKGGFSLPMQLFVDISFIFWKASPPFTGMYLGPAQEDVDGIFFFKLLGHYPHSDPSVSRRAFFRICGWFCSSRMGVGTDRYGSQSPLLSPVETFFLFSMSHNV